MQRLRVFRNAKPAVLQRGPRSLPEVQVAVPLDEGRLPGAVLVRIPPLLGARRQPRGEDTLRVSASERRLAARFAV